MARRKSKRQRMIQKLDKLWGEIVRSVGHCEVCHSSGRLNAHHIFSRANLATRWNPMNGVALCVHHHVWNPDFSAHLTPEDFLNWVRKIRGPATIDRLYEMRRGPAPDLEEVWKWLNTIGRACPENPDYFIGKTGTVWSRKTGEFVESGAEKIARIQTGKRTGRSKLTEDQVRHIRQNPDVPIKQLAKQFGVSYGCVYGVRTGKTWKGRL